MRVSEWDGRVRVRPVYKAFTEQQMMGALDVGRGDGEGSGGGSGEGGWAAGGGSGQ